MLNRMHKLRIYVDASVIGGCLDEEFREDSRALMQMARQGEAILVVSDLLADELALAPEPVQRVLVELPAHSLERVAVSAEAQELQQAYMNEHVVGVAQGNDALHVALATVARADIIVSWNFRHIVHFEKIRGFNAVNLREGYLPLEIRSPREVV